MLICCRLLFSLGLERLLELLFGLILSNEAKFGVLRFDTRQTFRTRKVHYIHVTNPWLAHTSLLITAINLDLKYVMTARGMRIYTILSENPFTGRFLNTGQEIIDSVYFHPSLTL